jgi:Dyp-type peroxidase family
LIEGILKYLRLHSEAMLEDAELHRGTGRYADIENKLTYDKRKQPGIGFPSASKQEHLLIIRLDLAPFATKEESTSIVRKGLRRLCRLFERIDNGSIRIDELVEDGSLKRSPLSQFWFSATIGFGIGFFERLNIPTKNRPEKLYEMPDHVGLGDPTPYSLAQTDLILQLGSTKDFVNRWVLENALEPALDDVSTKSASSLTPGKKRRTEMYFLENEEDRRTPDIVTAIKNWATITDVHAGFQRIDGRNLMGFNDGVSNPKRLSPIFDKVVWITADDESQPLVDGTYMVFQKIEHDLDQWRELDVDEQEEWVGRSKGTGLLLGTLSKNEDMKLSSDLQSNDTVVRGPALKRWKELIREQLDPEKRFFDDPNPKYRNIPLDCPIWSHVRKANPRQADGAEKKLIFRRGYPYIEGGLNGKIHSGLLFICFQKDIENGFQHIKKEWLNNKAFPVPKQRNQFSKHELAKRHQHGRFTAQELRSLTIEQRRALGLDDVDSWNCAIENADCKPEQTRMELESKIYYSRQMGIRNPQSLGDCDTQNTGREGLAGPSELGINPTGEFIAIMPFGGGYYFIPPIPTKRISEIGQQFF